MFVILTDEEDITPTFIQPDAALGGVQELPSRTTASLETPETYTQAHAGPLQ